MDFVLLLVNSCKTKGVLNRNTQLNKYKIIKNNNVLSDLRVNRGPLKNVELRKFSCMW